MGKIKIVSTGKYLPRKMVTSSKLANDLNITEDFILERTGIEKRYYSTDEENICYMAEMAVKNLIEKSNIEKEKIEMIIVATTTTKHMMPRNSLSDTKKISYKKLFLHGHFSWVRRIYKRC